MQRFRASSYGVAVANLVRTATMIYTADQAGMGKDDNSDRGIVRASLAEVTQLLDELPLSHVLNAQFDRLKKAADHEQTGSAELVILVRELVNNITVELTAAWFLMIPAGQRELYEQRAPVFGESVSRAFPLASSDMAAAGRCYALDEWTACVFHLMRVLELGLRQLASIVELPADATNHENWKNIIDRIEKKIREMEDLPKSPEKIARLQILSEAATQFRWFKDAWRNHVAHAHASYDNKSAPLIWTHVRAFMQQLAAL